MVDGFRLYPVGFIRLELFRRIIESIMSIIFPVDPFDILFCVDRSLIQYVTGFFLCQIHQRDTFRQPEIDLVILFKGTGIAVGAHAQFQILNRTGGEHVFFHLHILCRTGTVMLKTPENDATECSSAAAPAVGYRCRFPCAVIAGKF